MWPSLGPDAIVFENAGYLYTFDFQSKQPKKLASRLPADRAQAMKRWDNVEQASHGFRHLRRMANGRYLQRAAMCSLCRRKREAFATLPARLAFASRRSSWSPDGRWIAYISDRTGEDEIYIAPQDGMGKEQQITSGYKGFKFASWLVAGQQEDCVGR